MLQLIRDNAQGVVVWIIIIMVVIGLSSFILADYIGGSSREIAAEVNGEKISAYNLQVALNTKREQFQQQLGEHYTRFFNETVMRESVLNQLINNELLNQFIDEAKIQVGEERVINLLYNEPSFRDADGQFSEEMLNDWLKNTNQHSAQAFVAKQARTMALSQLKDGVLYSALSLPSEVALMQKLTRQQRNVSILRIKKQELVKAVAVSENDVRTYYDAHQNDYMSPEQVKLDYIELSMKDIVSAQTVSEDEINAYYELNKKQFIKDNFAEAEKKIKEIEKRMQAGEAFDKLAKELSQDIASARNGGDLGMFGKGLMEKPFEDTAFALKQGEVSKPVKTRYGYHLIKLDEIAGEQRRARHILIKASKTTKSLDEARDVITNLIKGKKAEKVFYQGESRLEELSNKLHQDSLEPASTELNLPIKTSPFISRQGGPQIFRNAELLQQAFGEEVLKDALNSTVIRISEDHLVVIRLKEHKASALLPFEQVKQQAENQLKQEKAAQQVGEILKEKLAKINSGADAASLVSAGEKALSWDEYGFIGRQAAFDQNRTADANGKVQPTKFPLQSETRKAAFSIQPSPDNKPVYQSLTANNGDGVIVALNAVRDNPVAEEKSALAAMQKQLKVAAGSADAEAIIEYMRSKSDIKINKLTDEDS